MSSLAAELGIRPYYKRVPNRTALGDLKTSKAEYFDIALPYLSILGPYPVDDLHLPPDPEQNVGPRTTSKFYMDHLGARLRPFMRGAR